MKGYSKMKGNSAFIQRSKSNKEFVFLDKDFDLLSSKTTNKKTHLVHEHESSIPDQGNSNKKNGFLIEKPDVHVLASFELDRQEEYNGGYHESLNLKQGSDEKSKGVLRRNFSVSSTNSLYKKVSNNSNNKGNNNSCLERQSSTRAIQEAVKRAFSIRRSTSVNSDKYCRIYDQPNMSFDDCDYVNYDDVHDSDKYQDGSLDTRYVSMMKKNTDHHNHGRMHVGSKVVKACKRLFSR